MSLEQGLAEFSSWVFLFPQIPLVFIFQIHCIILLPEKHNQTKRFAFRPNSQSRLWWIIREKLEWHFWCLATHRLVFTYRLVFAYLSLLDLLWLRKLFNSVKYIDTNAEKRLPNNQRDGNDSLSILTIANIIRPGDLTDFFYGLDTWEFNIYYFLLVLFGSLVSCLLCLTSIWLSNSSHLSTWHAGTETQSRTSLALGVQLATRSVLMADGMKNSLHKSVVRE